MDTSEILQLIRNDPFGSTELPRDRADYERQLVRAFEAGVVFGKPSEGEPRGVPRIFAIAFGIVLGLVAALIIMALFRAVFTPS